MIGYEIGIAKITQAKLAEVMADDEIDLKNWIRDNQIFHECEATGEELENDQVEDKERLLSILEDKERLPIEDIEILKGCKDDEMIVGFLTEEDGIIVDDEDKEFDILESDEVIISNQEIYWEDTYIDLNALRGVVRVDKTIPVRFLGEGPAEIIFFTIDTKDGYKEIDEYTGETLKETRWYANSCKFRSED